MSKLITNTIRHTGGSADNITLDNSQNVTVENNLTVDGTSTFGGQLNVNTNSIVTSGWGSIKAPEAQGFEINSIGSPNKYMISAKGAGAVSLYHNGTKQCETSANGLAFPSGKGIDFAATADGHSGGLSELLDDYEEGYYVPTLNANLSHSSGSYNTFSYTKIGRSVTVRGLFYPGSWSGSDAVTVSLPFASANLTQIANAGGMSVMFSNIDNASAGLACFVEDNSSIMKFYLLEGGNSNWVRLNNSHFNSGAEIYLVITYFST